MSLQVQSSQQPTSGRRTPQIYQNLGTPGSATSSPAAASSTNGNSGGSAKGSSKLSLKSSGGSGKQSPIVVEVAAVPEPTAPKDSPKTPNLFVAVTKLDKTPTGTSPKAADKEKDEKVTNGSSPHSEKETNGKHEEPSTVVTKAETPKRESVEKVEKEKKAKESPRASPRSTPQKQQHSESIPVEQVKTPESAGKKTTPVVTPEQKKKADHSLAAEKTLKGFTAEGDEMESLVVEPTEYEDSPMPPRTGGKTKLLKYAGAPPTRARISPFRVHEAVTNASTIVNLSTVSEGGQSSATESKEGSPSMDFNRPLRAISGRRGTRPISDIQYTYRKSTELNDSSSSLNVTVGSDIHNDSLRTPAPGSSRKRKAMTPESTSDALDVQEVLDSPKRTRLDFSGFLGMVASPVTMLKNRLSRVRLQSSTPVAKRNFDDEDPSKCVQAEATTTTANISGEGAATMDVDAAEAAAATPDEAKPDQEKTEQGEQQPSTEGQTDLPSEEKTAATQEDGSGDGSESPVEVKDVTNKQRSLCVVM